MARIRTVKPSFFTSLTIAELSYTARLTFIGLLTHVDDDGRCVADTRLIRAAIWPLDDRTLAEVKADLDALTESSLIAHYEVEGRRYYWVRTFTEHQRINRKTESVLPAPEMGRILPPTSGDEDSLSPHGASSEVVHREGKGREWKGMESAAPPAQPDPPAKAVAPAAPDAAKEAATEAYEAIGKAGKFMALHGHAKWALKERQLTHAQFVAVVVEVYKAGRPVTRESLGQAIDGHKRGGSKSRNGFLEIVREMEQQSNFPEIGA